ncbi:hypothetical protein FB451DRAFT_1187869 [Mycena latifolia]|nr:hypothetical protein FB451DRAFT_1187869 [Mycena latifolia]
MARQCRLSIETLSSPGHGARHFSAHHSSRLAIVKLFPLFNFWPAGVTRSLRRQPNTFAALRNMLFSSSAAGPWSRVKAGEIPLVIKAHKADIMATLLLLKPEFEAPTSATLRMKFAGATDAHLLAAQIGAAGVSVTLAPAHPYPASWDSHRILPGPPLSRKTASPSDFYPAPSVVLEPSPMVSSPSYSNHKITIAGREITAIQLASWDRLAAKFDETRLRTHQWEWITSGKDANSYLPYYTFQPSSKVTAIWDEWASGLNGFLAVRDLEETWGAKWRRNNTTQKTEMGRRKKVIQLVEKLAAKPNWGLALALRFMEKFDGKWAPRKFYEHLQAGALSATDEILVQSSFYVK